MFDKECDVYNYHVMKKIYISLTTLRNVIFFYYYSEILS